MWVAIYQIQVFRNVTRRHIAEDLLSHSNTAVRVSGLTGFIYLLTPQDCAAQVLLMD